MKAGDLSDSSPLIWDLLSQDLYNKLLVLNLRSPGFEPISFKPAMQL